MIKAEGLSKINAVEVGELEYVAIGPPTPVLTVKFAYANAESGDRYGYSNRNSGWSGETLEKLAALVQSVESDIIKNMFEDGATTSSVTPQADTAVDGVPSL